MIVLLDFRPPEFSGGLNARLISVLERIFQGLDTLVFSPEYVLNVLELDDTYADLRRHVERIVGGDRRPLPSPQFHELIKVFDYLLHAERDVLIIEGFILDRRTLSEWEQIAWKHSLKISVFDVLDRPKSEDSDKDHYYDAVARFFQDKQEGIDRMVSVETLLCTVKQALRNKGVRELHREPLPA